MTRLIVLFFAAIVVFAQQVSAPFGNATHIQSRPVDPTAPTNTQPLMWKCTVPSAVFTGAGLNDATAAGTCTTSVAALYDVVIDSSVASPDTFKWRKDGGSYTTGVSMTGAAQTLADGVTITFKATDGHTLADAWAIPTTVSWAPSSVASTELSDTAGIVRGAAALTTDHKVVAVSTVDGSLEEIPNQTVNTVYAGPGSGAAAAPAFRALALADIPAATKTRSLGFTFDNGATALAVGTVGYYTVPFACTIAAWNATVDAGTITVDVWKIATGTAIPTASNKICASACPAIASGTALHSTTLTGWTTAVAANDIFGFYVSAAATATKASVTLECGQ